MSAPDKPDLVRTWAAAEQVLDEEADRLATLSDEDFDREMQRLPEPARLPSADEIVERARARERRTPSAPPARRKRQTPLIVWLIAAALAMLLIVLLLERRDNVAAPHRDRSSQPDGRGPE